MLVCGYLCRMPAFHHFSYDSPWNPWFGGGGAQKDFEILKRLQLWEKKYSVAGFPGCELLEAQPNIQRNWFGRGSNKWFSRFDYAYNLQRWINRHPIKNDEIWSISPSSFSPVPGLLRYPNATAISLFHVVGWNAWKKYGPLGLVSIWHENEILRKGKYFLCINDATTEYVRKKRSDANVYNVPTGFTPLLEMNGVEKRKQILFVGRIDIYMKGLDRLIRAFQKVIIQHPDVDLVIAGRGNQESLDAVRKLAIESNCLDRVRVEVDITDKRKSELFHESMIFCSPSRFEGWCIAAVEAQSCAIPVVATNAHGFLSSVENGKSGILVDNQEATVIGELSQTLNRLIENPTEREMLGSHGLVRASQFGWDAVADVHEKIYHKILLGKNAG
jgi:glycosyltransferase involved in cell wall biosynthesis